MEAATQTAVLVEIEPGRAALVDLVGAIDAALRSELSDVVVRVPLAAGDERREPLEQLCAADSRIVLGPAPRADVTISMPPRARPEPRALAAIAALIQAEGLASVRVAVPGRFPRLPSAGRIVARASGTGSRTLRPGEIGLRSTASRGAVGPPPKTTLEGERAEHLRHRARSATMRARMDRNNQRLYRERLQNRHDRTRHMLAEQRLATTSSGQWVVWRVRGVGRRIAAIPAAAGSLLSSVRVFFRRARRFAAERWRSRGAQA